MKTLYWHRRYLPRTLLLFYCVFVLAGLLVVEHFQQREPQPYFAEKLQAATLANQALHTLSAAHKALGLPINPDLDPTRSGLIGDTLTPTTTDTGSLYIKQTVLNPNMAALMVIWLKEAGLKPGATIAVGMTGSFPSLDVAALAAIHTLQLRPLLIFSAGASQYGANLPQFDWITMYHILQEQGVFPYAPLGASLGGQQDNAWGMDPAGRKALLQSIRKANIPLINSRNTWDGINQRMELYRRFAEHPIAAYLNVGGGIASIGLTRGVLDRNVAPLAAHPLPTGVVASMPVSLAHTDSVAVRFLKQGVPVINVHDVRASLLKQYGFPHDFATIPKPGVGLIFTRAEYNPWLTLAVLILDVLVFILLTVLSKRYWLRYVLKK